MSTTPDDNTPHDGTPPSWGASVDRVRQLVLDVNPAGRILGQRDERVDDDTLTAWLEQGAGLLRVATARAAFLPATATPGWALAQDDVDLARRQLLELYAAALLADVTRPASDGRGIGAVLRARYVEALEWLTTAIGAAVDGPHDVTPTEPGVQRPGAVGRFHPSPRIKSRPF